MSFQSIQRAHFKPQAIKGEHCGAVRYKTPHKLSAVHVRALMKLAQANQPATRYEAGIGKDGSEYGNFAAMRWWGLIESHPGNRWSVTPLGWDFLAHKAWIPAHVWTIDGEVVGQDPERISIRSVVDEETWDKAEYVARRVPVLEPGALVA